MHLSSSIGKMFRECEYADTFVFKPVLHKMWGTPSNEAVKIDGLYVSPNRLYSMERMPDYWLTA